MDVSKLTALVDEFLAQVNQMELLTDPAIRSPASKHQRVIKEVHDLIKGFDHNYNQINKGEL